MIPCKDCDYYDSVSKVCNNRNSMLMGIVMHEDTSCAKAEKNGNVVKDDSKSVAEGFLGK